MKKLIAALAMVAILAGNAFAGAHVFIGKVLSATKSTSQKGNTYYVFEIPAKASVKGEKCDTVLKVMAFGENASADMLVASPNDEVLMGFKDNGAMSTYEMHVVKPNDKEDTIPTVNRDKASVFTGDIEAEIGGRSNAGNEQTVLTMKDVEQEFPGTGIRYKKDVKLYVQGAAKDLAADVNTNVPQKVVWMPGKELGTFIGYIK